MEKIVVAICYDFDKTLTLDDMQTFSFIPNLGMEVDEFWDRCDTFAKENQMDCILCCMKTMIETCREKNIKLTREYLHNLGKDVKFFEGVDTWFKRLNECAEKLGIILEHYIISSGNKEIIEGTPIFKEFKDVYACEFLYDENGEAYWPKSVMNPTQKTQFLFRICKGTHDLSDGQSVNQRVHKKHVEYRNLIYVGDGFTDVPCMALVREKGGTSVSIYHPNCKNDKTIQLIEEDRVNYACEGDFRAGSQLENLFTLILESIALKEKLIAREEKKSK